MRDLQLLKERAGWRAVSRNTHPCSHLGKMDSAWPLPGEDGVAPSGKQPKGAEQRWLPSCLPLHLLIHLHTCLWLHPAGCASPVLFCPEDEERLEATGTANASPPACCQAGRQGRLPSSLIVVAHQHSMWLLLRGARCDAGG